ncbi:Para-nitrobenzyl esterase [Talaromyces pinophilus]|nr:Para-nitrobenzyl esterase [Talaromyces pinophilus]
MQDRVLVSLPTWTQPSITQTVLGKRGSIDGIEEFRGIPYGKVPGRWQHAVLLDRLPQDIFDATHNGPRCPQPPEPNNSDFYQSYLEFPGDVEESEFDCLNLFVTRPSRATLLSSGEDTKLPVYAYIHGGAYAFGAGTDPMWDPARLVAKSVEIGTPIIVVTINYRLNLFGFAASSEIIDSQSPGQTRGCNFGLGDQNVALGWVKRNIGAFGGDSSRITVGGQSAGGSSSHAHILDAILGSKAPLVQRAIVQSGAVGVLGPLTMTHADARWAVLCEKLGAPAEAAAERMEFMRNVPPGAILRAYRELGWNVCPLVQDDLTISRRADNRWNVHFLTSDDPVADVGACDKPGFAVLIGDTELEGAMHRFQVTQIKSLEDLKDRLTAGLLEETFWDAFCNIYRLGANMPVASLHEQIFRFLSDIQFGYPVQQAREDLMTWGTSAKDLPQHKSASDVHPIQAHSYRVELGNPFPGPNHRVAHHCVDLIYIYDTFHDALRAIDMASPTNGISNAELVDRIQTDWITFIAAPSINEARDLATVYGSDRNAKVVNMSSDKDWLDRKRRFDFISQHTNAARQAAKIVTGGDDIS